MSGIIVDISQRIFTFKTTGRNYNSKYNILLAKLCIQYLDTGSTFNELVNSFENNTTYENGYGDIIEVKEHLEEKLNEKDIFIRNMDFEITKGNFKKYIENDFDFNYY